MQKLASAWISWHMGLLCSFHGHYLFCDAQANMDVECLALISISQSFLFHTNCLSEVTGRSYAAQILGSGDGDISPNVVIDMLQKIRGNYIGLNIEAQSLR